MTHGPLKSSPALRSFVAVVSFVPVVALAGVAGCSGGDLALPQPVPDVKLALVSGDQQTGVVGEQLPKPILVEVRDRDGHVLAGREVVFVTTDGPAAAKLTPSSAMTDGEGQVLGQWVLGTKPGAYSAEARLKPEDESADADPPAVQFTASAQAGPPDTLRAESEIQQLGQSSEQPVDEPPVVRVVDRYGNPVPGVRVRWDPSGGSTVSDETVQTDADGRATVTWTLGRQRFTVYRLSASVEGLVPVGFTAVVF